MVITGNINKIFRNIISGGESINSSYMYIWRTLLLFIALSGLAVVLERGGIQETGLWGMLFDAERYDLLRELSHKSMDNAFVKKVYSYSLLLIPFVSVSAFLLLKHKKYKKEAFLGLLIIVFVALLSGSRGHIVTILLCYLLFIVITNSRVPMEKVVILIGLGFVLVVALTAMRSDRTRGYEDFSIKAYQVVRRVIAAPFYTGVVHMEYVKQYGLWDYSSVIGFPGKGVLDFKHVNHFRVVGEWETGLEASNMNTSEIFLEMSIFDVGIGSFVSIAMFLMADLFVLCVGCLKKTIRLPAFITMLVYFKSLVGTGILEIVYKCLMLILILYALLVIRNFLLILSRNNLSDDINKNNFNVLRT